MATELLGVKRIEKAFLLESLSKLYENQKNIGQLESFDDFIKYCWRHSNHYTKKWSFSSRKFSVNVTNSANGFDNIYWKDSQWKTFLNFFFFFLQWIYSILNVLILNDLKSIYTCAKSKEGGREGSGINFSTGKMQFWTFGWSVRNVKLVKVGGL